METLSRLYNQNRKTIWIIILIIMLIIVLIHILDRIAFKNITQDNTINKDIENINNKEYSIVTQKVNKNSVSYIIEDFLEFCYNKQIEQAYDMLSNDCKECLYPSVDDFKEKYYSKLFTEQQTYTYQAWIAYEGVYTYRVDFVDDMLATGKAATSSITDYYTVVKEDEQYKLNINKFIGTQKTNLTKTKNNIVITINKRKIFMDYEKYEIEIYNNLSENLFLDSECNPDSIYIYDESGNKYNWFNNEIIEEDLVIKSKQKQQFDIKFDKKYKPENKITGIVFSNIIDNENNIYEIEIFL